MTTPLNNNREIRIFLASNFFWNFGRTIPHAILTIYLLSIGVSLQEVALLQIVFMATVTMLEFPSGVLSDHWSRKSMYILSVALILLGYVFIFFSEGNMIYLYIAWFLYGASTAAKSGTLESEIVNRLNAEKKDLKKFTAMDSHIQSISSAVGAVLGSLCYHAINEYIYIISVVAFIISILISLGFRTKARIKDEATKQEKVHNKFSVKETISTLRQFFKTPILSKVILLFTSLSFFLQPFFQYWQVLYQFKDVPVIYFGYAYVIFQVCNMIGVFIYQRLSYHIVYSYVVLLLVIVSSYMTIEFTSEEQFFFLFPITLCLYYVYYQYLVVELRRNSPQSSISTLNSLIGTLVNVSSILVLLAISFTFKFLNVVEMYHVFYMVFFILSIAVMLWTRYRVSREPKITTNEEPQVSG